MLSYYFPVAIFITFNNFLFLFLESPILDGNVHDTVPCQEHKLTFVLYKEFSHLAKQERAHSLISERGWVLEKHTVVAMGVQKPLGSTNDTCYQRVSRSTQRPMATTIDKHSDNDKEQKAGVGKATPLLGRSLLLAFGAFGRTPRAYTLKKITNYKLRSQRYQRVHQKHYNTSDKCALLLLLKKIKFGVQFDYFNTWNCFVLL